MQIKRIKQGFSIIAVILLTGIIILPLPWFLLDLFTIFIFTFAVLVVLISVYSKKNTGFSLLPSCLLVLTLFGLAIQISFTRLILTKGDVFDGRIIHAISSIITAPGGIEDIIAGFLIFTVFTAVVAELFTQNTIRLTEIAERFMLDSLPGKLIAVETELNSEAISEGQAVSKKGELQKETDFFNSLDGVCKFLSGNYKIGLFITAVSIIGGLFIGIKINGEAFIDAMMIYVPLSIGNSFLAQLLVLLECISIGIIINKKDAASS